MENIITFLWSDSKSRGAPAPVAHTGIFLGGAKGAFCPPENGFAPLNYASNGSIFNFNRCT